MVVFCSLSTFLRKHSKILLVLFSIYSSVHTLHSGISEEKSGWEAFGYGVLDSTMVKDKEQIGIQVDWERTVLGVGCMIEIDSDADINEVEEIQFQAFTDKGSQTSLVLEIETTDGTRLTYPVSSEMVVDAKRKVFRFPLDELHSNLDSNLVDLKGTDSTSISQIKILFAKPENDNDLAKDIIYVNKPELIYSKPFEDKEVSLEEPILADIEFPLLSETIENYLPLITGTGVKDWGTVERTDQMFVVVKWSQSTKGVTIRFQLPSESTNEMLKMLKFDARTAYYSRSEIWMRVATESDITLYEDSSFQPEVTANWREYTFDFSGCTNLEGDDSIAKFVEIFVKNPIVTTVSDRELILIRNPRLVKIQSESTGDGISEVKEHLDFTILNQFSFQAGDGFVSESAWDNFIIKSEANFDELFECFYNFQDVTNSKLSRNPTVDFSFVPSLETDVLTLYLTKS